MVTKIERQLKINGSTHQEGNLSFFLAQRLNYKRDKTATSKSNIMVNKVESSKNLFGSMVVIVVAFQNVFEGV